MQPLQIFLVLLGAALAVGGVAMLVRMSRRDDTTRGPYVPFGMVAVGLIIAYRSYSDFATLDPQDLTIMFFFAIALLSLLGLQFFIVDRSKQSIDRVDKQNPDNVDTKGGGPWTT